jgi:pyruvate kinase
MIHTKIVVTLGPASSEPAVVRQLAEAGADVFRLNFSHADHAVHERALQAVRQAGMELGRPLAVLQDLCGPKIRIGPVEGGPRELAAGDTVTVGRGRDPAEPKTLWTIYDRFVDDLKAGERVLVDDGQFELVVAEKKADAVVLKATRPGRISSGKGINLPGTQISSPAVTEKDLRDLEWGIRHGVDLTAVSFVRRAEDVLTVREHLQKAGSPAWVIAKIEKPEAVSRLEEIAAACDGLMVARGDLGVEMDTAAVPVVQKRMIRLARDMFKPVVTATQMLQSMVDNPTPTRAEVGDVANAILDGSDGIMLSGETAVGKYPVEAVRVMNHIAMITETWLGELRRGEGGWRDPFPEVDPGSAAAGADFARAAGVISRGMVRTALNLGAKMIVIHSVTGRQCIRISKCRSLLPIVAVTDRVAVARQMNLLWGAFPLHLPTAADMADMLRAADGLGRTHGWVKPGDTIVGFSRYSLSTDTATQTVMVHRVGP